MAPHLGTPLRSLAGTPDCSFRRRQPPCLEDHIKQFELAERRLEEERARQRTLKARLKRALTGAARTVKACGSRLSFRLRNRQPYPRLCSAPPALPASRRPTPLHALTPDALRSCLHNLEEEERTLLDMLRELCSLVAIGDHMQPASCDPDRLAHVKSLLLSGRVAEADADYDNDDVLHAAILEVHSLRLELALQEVQAQIHALCAERRRRREEQRQREQEQRQAALAVAGVGACCAASRGGARRLGTDAATCASAVSTPRSTSPLLSGFSPCRTPPPSCEHGMTHGAAAEAGAGATPCAGRRDAASSDAMSPEGMWGEYVGASPSMALSARGETASPCCTDRPVSSGGNGGNGSGAEAAPGNDVACGGAGAGGGATAVHAYCLVNVGGRGRMCLAA